MPLRARLRSLQWPFTLMVLLVLASGVLIATDRWRRGAVLLGITMLIGGVLRAVLREHQAGLLAVRNKPVDVLTFAAFGAAILVLATSISSLGTV